MCTLVPLARYIGRATESVAIQSNHTVGGLMNATFGNLIELLVSVFAIRRGLMEVVKASIVGSIIGNILLLIGASMFFGGLKYTEQRFNRYSAGVSATMLVICCVGLAIPSVYSRTSGGEYMPAISGVVSGLLAAIYICGLIFALVTHRHLFDTWDELKAAGQRPEWPLRKASVVLAVMIVNSLAADGRCNWLEGAQLVAVYLILATVFYFI